MIGRWSRLPAPRRRLLVEATVELFVARLELLPVPGADWQKALGSRSELVPSDGPRTGPGPGPSPPTGQVDDLAREVGWAVRTAAARVPWRSVCLPQAIAAQHMLRRRSIAARAVVGARRSEAEKPIDLHVWVVVGGRVVVGGAGHSTFSPVIAYDA